jgi:glycosyltransferase involved in cell wall biosynthesis
LFRHGRYQVVHAHGWPAVLLVALASLVAGEPAFVLTEHSVTNRRRRWRLKPLDLFVYGRFQRVIAVSQAAAEALLAWLPQTEGRIRLIYNGLEPAGFGRNSEVRLRVRQALAIGESVPVILFAGGLQAHKGADVLLNALGRLPDGEAFARPLTLMAGLGEAGGEFEEVVGRLRLDGGVRFLGFRSDLADLMAAADLFVLASRWEGCPMAVLEAMAMGLPVIASRVGGVPEMIEDGVSGLLLPAGDALALSRAITHLLGDRALACQLGQAARRRVENCFTVQQGAGALAAVYREVV